jgi:hypothetical protein
MKRIATTAMAAAMMLAGTAQAQQPAQRPQAQRPPAQAQRPPAQAQRPPAPAVPTRVTARTLTALCGQDRSGCLTYILGAVDSFSSALVAAGRPQVYCFPRGTTNDQIAQRVVAYLRARPQEGGNNAALVILAGLTASYPCGY